MKHILAFTFILFTVGSFAQQVIIPRPQQMEVEKELYILPASLQIVTNKGRAISKTAEFLQTHLSTEYNIQSRIKKAEGLSAEILLEVKNELKTPGSYNLEISGSGIKITGSDDAGVFYGMQSLLQLLEIDSANKVQVPYVKINDWPRFEHRGMHLDVSRHFFDLNYVKKYIDLLAIHKFNKFHWHLTDDQGWRIEIKKFPLLTTIGSCRDQTLVGRFGSDVYDGKKYCGFYTQEEIKEVVKYASDRFITVIPEIDVPGHSLAALASYPFLGCTKGPYKVRETWAVQPDIFCAGNDSTYKFIEGVLDEVTALFPSEYIHIGGDEAPKERWKNCPKCQQRIRKLKLKNEHELHTYFVGRIEKYLSSKGRKTIGWDEIMEGGLAPNTVVMSWRGMKGGIAAAKLSHEVIMMPEQPLYLNLSQSKNEDSVTQGGYNSLEMVYNYEPVPAELNKKEAVYIKGIQGGAWTEYISNPSKLEYMLFPRMSALAEVAWTNTERRNWDDFAERLPGIMEKYKKWKVNYSTAYYDLQSSVVPVNDSVSWKFETKRKGKIIYVKSPEQNVTYNYDPPLMITESGKWGAAITDEKNKINGNWIWQEFRINKATGKKIKLATPPNSRYGGQGGFTLVDGVQNEKQMLKAHEFLGFIGTDLDAIIDLGEETDINEVVLHCFEQAPSWIYRPSKVSIQYSSDGISFVNGGSAEVSGHRNLEYKWKLARKARYIKIKAENNGIIKPGLPGAGGKAWLFADEIEIN